MGRKSNRNQNNQRGKSPSASQLARKIKTFLDNHYGEEYSAKQIIKKTGNQRLALQKCGRTHSHQASREWHAIQKSTELLRVEKGSGFYHWKSGLCQSTLRLYRS